MEADRWMIHGGMGSPVGAGPSPSLQELQPHCVTDTSHLHLRFKFRLLLVRLRGRKAFSFAFIPSRPALTGYFNPAVSVNMR